MVALQMELNVSTYIIKDTAQVSILYKSKRPDFSIQSSIPLCNLLGN